MRLRIFICLLLGGITLAIYWPARHFDIVFYDDPKFLTYVDVLYHGITWAGIKWALTSVIEANWHPVTNLSFLALSQFYGADPGPQHLANATVHAANAVLLFLLFQRLTGLTWRSATVAGLFAWHPLRVESVAWIAERKDVLCTFFYLLSLWGYSIYVEKRKKASADNPRQWTIPLVWSLAAFTLALLSKPMAVTLPFVLLLLDFWPLGRLAAGQKRQSSVGTTARQSLRNFFQLALEKWPFFLLTLLFCAVTYHLQSNPEIMLPWSVLGFSDRLVNCINAYTGYLGKTFWPTNLAIIYPLYPWHDYLDAILKGCLLAFITLECLLQWNKRPWLAMGWFWYLGTALPIIGLVQVGAQAMADRYTYIPLIGPVVAMVWTAAEGLGKLPGGKAALATAAIVICGALAVISERQLQYWRNTIDLFGHTLAVTPINPAAAYAWGLGFEHAGQYRHATTTYRMLVMMAPDDDSSSDALTSICLRESQLVEAEAEMNRFLSRHPDNYSFRLKLANLYAKTGHVKESTEQLDQLVSYHEGDPYALNNLAWSLATCLNGDIRDGARAVQLAEHACELTNYKQTQIIGTLAAAYAEAGRFDDAVATAKKAIASAQQQGETALVQKNEELLELYRQHKAYHEASDK